MSDQPYDRPTDEEYAAALERANAADAAALETLRIHSAAAQEAQEANRVALRMAMLRRDLDEVLLDTLRHDITTRARTAQRLARYSYRDVGTVQAALDRLVATGMARKVGPGYEAVGT